mmetsp:Transcript_29988/g.47642  ORF Transcript_29988/g.47642 Transcript_29988/m.47642 type:complete len:98 (+) Transcript_29988:2050-2343(+)
MNNKAHASMKINDYCDLHNLIFCPQLRFRVSARVSLSNQSLPVILSHNSFEHIFRLLNTELLDCRSVGIIQLYRSGFTVNTRQVQALLEPLLYHENK